jgi:uncharacterized protein (TIGR03792 family)
MRIERLEYVVSPSSKAEDFIKADEQIWTAWLRQQPGYLNKTVRRQVGGKVEIQIFWKSKEDWTKAAKKKKEMTVLENRMKNLLGPVYRLSYRD